MNNRALALHRTEHMHCTGLITEHMHCTGVITEPMHCTGLITEHMHCTGVITEHMHCTGLITEHMHCTGVITEHMHCTGVITEHMHCTRVITQLVFSDSVNSVSGQLIWSSYIRTYIAESQLDCKSFWPHRPSSAQSQIKSKFLYKIETLQYQ